MNKKQKLLLAGLGLLVVATAGFIFIIQQVEGIENTKTSSEAAAQPPEKTLREESDFLQEFSAQLAEYYPPGVEFEYWSDRTIQEQQCSIFAVVHKDWVVSYAALSSDGQVWILDMYSGDPEDSEALWHTADWYAQEDAKVLEKMSEPVTIIYDTSESQDSVALVVQDLPELPEFSQHNSGAVLWQPAENTVQVSLAKITGMVDGAPAGPMVQFTVVWKDGEPILETVDDSPATIYSNPRLVLHSGETLELTEKRLLELGEYFKSLAKEYAGISYEEFLEQTEAEEKKDDIE